MVDNCNPTTDNEVVDNTTVVAMHDGKIVREVHGNLTQFFYNILIILDQ